MIKLCCCQLASYYFKIAFYRLNQNCLDIALINAFTPSHICNLQTKVWWMLVLFLFRTDVSCQFTWMSWICGWKKKRPTYLNRMDGEYGRLNVVLSNVVLSVSFPFEMKLLFGIIFHTTYSVVKTHRQGFLRIILMSHKCFFLHFWMNKEWLMKIPLEI